MTISQSPRDTPVLNFSIKAPIKTVWQALREREQLARWHGWDTPSLSDEIDSIYFTDVQEESTNDATKRSLALNGGDIINLEANSEETRVALVRASLSGDPEWDAYYDVISEGWVSFMEQLRFMIERQSTTPRRTILHKAASTDWEAMVQKLGLGDVADGAVCMLTISDEPITGTVWFRTAHQVGVMVDDWGPGLIIVSANGSETSTTFIVSTYGLSEAEFKQLEQAVAVF